MNALAPARVGWCPGALTPMGSGDGLIVRVKPRGGRLSPKQATTIALVSERLGNKHIDITSRANLQIRGLEPAALPSAIAMLDDVGLLDPSPAAEAARNVVSSPLAGFDPFAVLDIRAAVSALESRLVGKAALHAVPAKFSFVVDDGGSFGLADVTADIRFEAFFDEAGPAFAVRVGGAENEAAGRCGPADIAQVAEALVGVFLQARATAGELFRMRHLVACTGAADVLCAAGLDLCSPPARPGLADWAQFIGYVERRPTPSHPPGRDCREPTISCPFLGVAAPFGRLSADQLELLGRETGQRGAAELRLTPWRAILIPGLGREAAAVLAKSCALAGLVLDHADPRLRVAACTGAPGCHRGSTPVLEHATRIAARLGHRQSKGVLLHVSGCRKGCAHADIAPLTLVAENGRYDVVVDGQASDPPIVHNLAFEEAAEFANPSAAMERQS